MKFLFGARLLIRVLFCNQPLSCLATLSQQHQYPTWYQSYNDYEENDYEPSIAVPVRSCFGGLTIYSAKALLEPSCRYHPPTVGEEANRLLKYANLDDKRPCEHVVFHDCLFQLNHKFGVESRIAIQPGTCLPREEEQEDFCILL